MTYRKQQTENAKQKLEAARAALSVARTKAQVTDANDEIEFWSNKLAFFTNIYIGAFPDERQVKSCHYCGKDHPMASTPFPLVTACGGGYFCPYDASGMTVVSAVS